MGCGDSVYTPALSAEEQKKANFARISEYMSTRDKESTSGWCEEEWTNVFTDIMDEDDLREDLIFIYDLFVELLREHNALKAAIKAL